MVSSPNRTRRIVSASLLILAFVYTVAVKFGRGSETVLAPDRLAGVMPNLVCGAVIPLAIFFSKRKIRYRDYLFFVGCIVIALIGYEFTQLLGTKRTFDRNDITASIVGGGIAVLIGTCFFRGAK